MKTIKKFKSYALYTLLCVGCFAVIYSLIWWISRDFFWYREMLETNEDRGSFVMMFLLTFGLSASVCASVRVAK